MAKDTPNKSPPKENTIGTWFNGITSMIKRATPSSKSREGVGSFSQQPATSSSEESEEDEIGSEVAKDEENSSVCYYKGHPLLYNKTKVKQLKRFCAEAGLHVSGKKSELIGRLKAHVRISKDQGESKEFDTSMLYKGGRSKLETYSFDGPFDGDSEKFEYKRKEVAESAPDIRGGYLPDNNQSNVLTVEEFNKLSQTLNSCKVVDEKGQTLDSAVFDRRRRLQPEFEVAGAAKKRINDALSSATARPIRDVSDMVEESKEFVSESNNSVTSRSGFSFHSGAQSVASDSQIVSSSLQQTSALARDVNVSHYYPGKSNRDPRVRQSAALAATSGIGASIKRFVPGEKRTRFSQLEGGEGQIIVPTSKRPRVMSTERRANYINNVRNYPLQGSYTQVQRPRPSKWLTGKDSSSIPAITPSAVARRITDVIQNMSTPLEDARSKPIATPGWAIEKYGSALQPSALEYSKPNEVLPPTTSIPKVPASRSRVFEEERKPSGVSKRSRDAELFKPETPAPILKAKKVARISEESPQYGERIKTPAVKSFATSTPSTVAKIQDFAETPMTTSSMYDKPETVPAKSKYAFSRPERRTVRGDASVNDTVNYLFSPPKSMAPPLIKTPGKGLKKPSVSSSGSGSAVKASVSSFSTDQGKIKPFSFMPSAPKTQQVPMPKKEASPVVKAAPAPKPVVPMDAANNPFAKFMTKSNTWKCDGCMVSNDNSVSKCPCCNADRPSGVTGVAPSAEKTDSAETKPNSNISFGVAAPAKTTEAANKDTAPKFSFGVPADTTEKDEKSGPGFSFSLPKPDASTKAAPPTTGFSFGLPSGGDKTNSDVKLDEPAAKKVQFGATASSNQAEKKPESTFSFGASKPEEVKSISPLELPPQSNPEEGAPKASFSFGTDSKAEKPVAAATTSGFSFGTAPAAETKPVTDAAAPSFSFGASSSQKTEKDTKAPGFTFGAPSTTKTEDKPAEAAKPSFSFGAPSTTKTEDKHVEAAKPSFTFGAPSSTKAEEKPAEAAKASFAFGGEKSTAKAESNEAPKAGFTFGAAPSQSGTVAKNDASKGPSFSFGATASTAAASTTAPPPPASTSSSAFQFNAAPSTTTAPASSSAAPFQFGGTPAATPSPATTGTFTFGGPASQGPAGGANPFANQAAPAPSPQPQQSSNQFGAAAPPMQFPPAGSSNAMSAFGAPQQSPQPMMQQNAFPPAAPQAAGFGFVGNAPSNAPPPASQGGFSFGAPQSNSFGMSGAQPTSQGANNAFGMQQQQQPQSSAFSIGTTQKTTKRRIVKARKRKQ